MELNKIYNMNCIEGLKQLSENSVDSIVTDPPYGLGFMGKEWDNFRESKTNNAPVYEKGLLKTQGKSKAPWFTDKFREENVNFQKFCEEWARECFRVLKPGGYILSFGGTRTYHRMACAIEDAGFEIRDQIQWIYSSGFPKSMNISKALNKKDHMQESEQWDGWGTTLKPAQEPIVVARKPLSERSIIDNILKWGVGGLNIDECRIAYKDENDLSTVKAKCNFTKNSKSIGFGTSDTLYGNGITPLDQARDCVKEEGRFPANIIFDEVSGKLLDEQSGITKSGKVKENKESYDSKSNTEFLRGITTTENQYGNSGGASRFFYCAKATKKEKGNFNNHPTVKPLSLIEYLIKLVTPEGGISLDLFEGSGTHAVACKKLGFNYIGFELDNNYINIIEKRIQNIK